MARASSTTIRPTTTAPANVFGASASPRRMRSSGIAPERTACSLPAYSVRGASRPDGRRGGARATACKLLILHSPPLFLSPTRQAARRVFGCASTCAEARRAGPALRAERESPSTGIHRLWTLLDLSRPAIEQATRQRCDVRASMTIVDDNVIGGSDARSTGREGASARRAVAYTPRKRFEQVLTRAKY